MTQGSTKLDSAALDPEEREVLRGYEEGRLRRASGSRRDARRLESAARETFLNPHRGTPGSIPDWQRELIHERLAALEDARLEERSEPWATVRRRIFADKA